MPNDAEVDRIMGLSDEEILAEIKERGLDPKEVADRGRAAFRRALAQVDADDVQEDLRQMLEALGMPDHARPYSPHRVFQEALTEMKLQLGERSFLRRQLSIAAGIIDELKMSAAPTATLIEVITKCIDVVESVDDVRASALGGDPNLNDAYTNGGREMQRDVLAALQDFKEASALTVKDGSAAT